MKERYEIRVEEPGLIEILVDGTEVVWGMHNSIYQRKKVKRGYLFNSLVCGRGSGFWHDVVPAHKEAGVAYFRRLGDWIPADEIELRNSKLV